MEPKDFDDQKILSGLFAAAKQKDEFEFCCTLLRVRGMEGPGWDPLRESQELSEQLLSLIHSPLVDALKLRLTLFLYCHVTEMSDLYNIVGNLLRVISGERYSMDPFIAGLHTSNKRAKYPAAKVERVSEWSKVVGSPIVGELFEVLLVKEVRNAFYHSDYVLTDDSFNIKRGEPVTIGRERTRKIPYEWLSPRLELGINVTLSVISQTIENIRSYQQDKIVSGRVNPDGSYTDIQLTTEQNYGLTGFKSPPDKGLAGKQTP